MGVWGETSVMVLVAALPSGDYQEAERLLKPFAELLPKQQLQSIMTNRRPVDRALRIMVRALLGYALHRLTGISVRELLTRLEIDERGRPQLPGVRFSFSHSPPYGVCALGPLNWDGRLGVDVEAVQELIVEDFVKVFNPGELAEIIAAPDSNRELIRRWTIKEAALKADGLGFLADPLNVTTGPGIEGRFENGLSWCHLPLDEKFWLTVATSDGEFMGMKMRRLTANDYLSIF